MNLYIRQAMKNAIIYFTLSIFLFSCFGKGSETAAKKHPADDEEIIEIDIHPSFDYDTFPVHFCVVTNNDSAKKFVSKILLRNEIDTLNKYFTAEDPADPSGRKKLVHFTYEGATFYDEAKQSGSALVTFLDQDRSYGGKHINSLFDTEINPDIRCPKAINIYIYDSWKRGLSRADLTGHGRRNGNEPYILLDYMRLGHRIQAPEEHEMGHCFGLEHRCDPSVATDTTPSNIMTSGQGCSGKGGARNIGFDKAQVDSIEKYSPKIIATLGL